MKTNSPRWLLNSILVLILLVLGLIIFLIYQNKTLKDTRIENLELTQKQSQLLLDNNEIILKKNAEIEALVKEIELGKESIATLEIEIEQMKRQSLIPSDRVLNRFNEVGFSSLQEFYETIDVEPPFEGVLGGTTRWYPENFFVINESWVLGDFEDGHFYGQALLKYTFGKDKQVKWEIIAAETF